MVFNNHFVRYWLPVCVWCTGIFIQSSFAAPRVVPEWPFMDKAAHALIYALLCVLICRAMESQRGRKMRNVALAVAGIVLTTLYGLSDEWHQSFVITRSADAADVGADFLGSIVGALVFTGLLRHRPRALKTKGVILEKFSDP